MLELLFKDRGPVQLISQGLIVSLKVLLDALLYEHLILIPEVTAIPVHLGMNLALYHLYLYYIIKDISNCPACSSRCDYSYYTL